VRTIIIVGLALVMVVGLMGTGAAGVATTTPADNSLDSGEVTVQTDLPEGCYRSTGPYDGDTADCWIKM
jgi:hypothetical protein